MERASLARAIQKACYLRGDFLLRSGKRSHEYFDKYQLEARPELLEATATHMAKLLPADTQVLAGLEMGGIPVATALSLKTSLPMAMVRKKAKSYGTQRLAEGVDVHEKNTLIVEDVITTGGQVVESALALRELGAQITTVVCVLDRSAGDHKRLNEAGLSLIALFTLEELKELSG